MKTSWNTIKLENYQTKASRRFNKKVMTRRTRIQHAIKQMVPTSDEHKRLIDQATLIAMGSNLIGPKNTIKQIALRTAGKAFMNTKDLQWITEFITKANI